MIKKYTYDTPALTVVHSVRIDANVVGAFSYLPMSVLHKVAAFVQVVTRVATAV